MVVPMFCPTMIPLFSIQSIYSVSLVPNISQLAQDFFHPQFVQYQMCSDVLLNIQENTGLTVSNYLEVARARIFIRRFKDFKLCECKSGKIIVNHLK